MVDLTELWKLPAGNDDHIKQQEAEQAAAMREYLATATLDSTQQRPVHGALPMPPGFVGALAQYVLQHAIRPVPEVAVVAALGIMAGIAGREWTTFTNSGLNLYIVLVARSAIGKEAMHTGIATVMRAAEVQNPDVRECFDFSEYASGPALIKGINLHPCLLNIAGEIGHKFLAMSKGRESALNSLRKVLTDLYSKSGSSGIVGGISYSSQDNNVLSADSVAYSLVGETTPGTFYESITDGMMSDGFMSRFLVIQYDGERPPENPTPLAGPPLPLVEWLAKIAQHAFTLRTRSLFCTVPPQPDARRVLDAFRDECDHNINAAGDDERLRQLWARAHLKALRVATLLAVGDQPFEPKVTLAQVEWAITLVRHGNAAFLKRIDAGEVGEGTDGGRERKVIDLCREFLSLPADHKALRNYKHGKEMQQNGIVPRRYLQQRTQRLAAFEGHKLGHTPALNMAIKTAIDNGALMEVRKDRLVEYSYFGQAYRALCLT
ncbi:DUF3987 domain-containing protein [Sphingomonas colocasiae]|uniref:DUF3987 domain-containing protein n=1 Tax=Sphingomonas colocasiae TaxID=1848973 RepID=A0ABS7PJC1_9SPHN|nr:DUF3987 domain-containing protein [Sphingomonas colocasiae]MBY8821381.1 DUF3987 domain-containing protein [Sphingomonas colocasiae]